MHTRNLWGHSLLYNKIINPLNANKKNNLINIFQTKI